MNNQILALVFFAIAGLIPVAFSYYALYKVKKQNRKRKKT